MKSESTYVLCWRVLLISSGAQSRGQERQKPATLALDKSRTPQRQSGAKLLIWAVRHRRVSDAGPQVWMSWPSRVIPGSSFQDGHNGSEPEWRHSARRATERARLCRYCVSHHCGQVPFRVGFYCARETGEPRTNCNETYSVQYISIPDSGGKKLRSDHSRKV